MRRDRSSTPIPVILGALLLSATPFLLAFLAPVYHCPATHGFGCREGNPWACRYCGDRGRTTWVRRSQFEREIEEQQRFLSDLLERIDTLEIKVRCISGR